MSAHSLLTPHLLSHLCLFRQLNLSNNRLCGVWVDVYGKQKGNYSLKGIHAIADALRVNGGLTALDLSLNELKDEGVSAVCEAIQSNKETKLASLDMGLNSIGSVGAKSVAAMVAVTGGLTSLDLSCNSLCRVNILGRGSYTAEGITAIAEALRVNGSLTECNLRANSIGAEGAKQLADALRVNGVLTSLNLSSNDIGGYWDDDQKTCVFTPVGPKAIADALLVNGGLTKMRYVSPQLEGLWAKIPGDVPTLVHVACSIALVQSSVLTLPLCRCWSCVIQPCASALRSRTLQCTAKGALLPYILPLDAHHCSLLPSLHILPSDAHHCSLPPDEDAPLPSLCVRSLGNNHLDEPAKRALRDAWRGVHSHLEL